jgi:PAS domain S-box-containing protein
VTTHPYPERAPQAGSVSNPADWLGLRAWIAVLLVAGLIVFHQLLIQPALSQLTTDAPVINVAGRQRMLSQKLSKAALAFVSADQQSERQRRREELEQILVQWSRAHRGLQYGDVELQLPGQLDPQLQTTFSELEQHFQAIVSAAEDLLASAPADAEWSPVTPRQTAAVRKILEHEADFLSHMHAIVGLFEAKARAHVAHLQRLGLSVMATILLILFVIQWSVIRPAVQLVQREFAQSEDQYRQLVESMSDGLVVHDLSGRIVFANRRFAEMLGRSPESLPGLPAAAFVTDADRRRYDELRNSTGDGQAVEIGFIKADGTSLETMISARMLLDAEGASRGCLLVVSDVTAHRRSQQLTRDLQDQLAHADRLKSMGELAAGLAHEINQPLGAIANYAEGCLAQLGTHSSELADELRGPLERMLQAALRGGAIIRRARRFSQLKPQPLTHENLNELVASVEPLFRMEARRRGIDLSVVSDAQLPCIPVDSVQIQQVLTNLIQNAFDALEQTPRYRRRVRITTRSLVPHFVSVSVADTGPGITAEQAGRIFEPFFTTRAEGTGMGLAIARGIVETHGGSILVETNSDGGATFTVQLPLAAPDLVAVTTALETGGPSHD